MKRQCYKKASQLILIIVTTLFLKNSFSVFFLKKFFLLTCFPLVIPMDQLVKEKLNYMISIEKNSFSGAQAVPKIPNTVPMRRACNKVYLTIINKASAQARVRRSSTLGVGFSDTDLAITQEILNPIERKKLIRNMFLERVLMVILHKARLNYESYLKAYLGREFKTLASYNYQVS